jgi:MerR family copper efflux transcriptional regulator
MEPERSRLMTIGELARRSRLTPKAIRRYEGMGLIYSAGRSPAGYRLFDESALWCAQVIESLRSLGFTIREIREVAAIYLRRPDEPVGPKLARQLEEVRRRVDAKLHDLNELRRRLDGFQRGFAEALAGRADIGSQDPRRRTGEGSTKRRRKHEADGQDGLHDAHVTRTFGP